MVDILDIEGKASSLKSVGDGQFRLDEPVEVVARRNGNWENYLRTETKPVIQAGETLHVNLISLEGRYSGRVHLSEKPYWWPASMFSLAGPRG